MALKGRGLGLYFPYLHLESLFNQNSVLYVAKNTKKLLNKTFVLEIVEINNISPMKRYLMPFTIVATSKTVPESMLTTSYRYYFRAQIWGLRLMLLAPRSDSNDVHWLGTARNGELGSSNPNHCCLIPLEAFPSPKTTGLLPRNHVDCSMRSRISPIFNPAYWVLAQHWIFWVVSCTELGINATLMLKLNP